MANISNNVNVHEGAAVTNWISQINAGGTVYDIATHHTVTFVEGNGGAKTTWNGLSDIEVIIPSITDIVQTPIEFVGTVKDGNIEWKNGHSAPAGAGNLVFITNDCTFEGIACEAGDMAIFDGEKWNIVTGENQVELVGTTDDNNRLTIAVGSAKDVLTVEGKTLALTLDYADLDKHVVLTPGGKVNVDFTKVTVDNDYIKLVKAADQTLSVGVDTTFDLPTELASDVVTLKNATGLVNSITWGTFTQGTQTDSSKNSEKKLDITGGSLTLSSGQTEGHFVDGVSMGDVTFVDADETDTNKIHVLTGITPGVGAEFLNGIHITGEDETADFTIAGFVKPTKDNVQFVEGLEGSLTPVTSITDGDFKLVAGTDLVTGFGAESTTSGDVLSNVTVTANNNASVLNSAYVEGNVLKFGSANVTNGVTVETKYKSLTKTGFEYTAPKATNTAFVTSGFEKVANVDYTFGRGNETTYTPTDAMWKLNTPDIVLTKGTYTLNQTNMKATVPAQSFVTTVTPGELPTWTGYDFGTTDITGTVDTTLTTTPKTLHVVDDDITTMTLPGAYTLEKGAAEDGVSLTVGKAGDVKTSVATVDLTGYITDVTIE
jgi:hypothetical protein